MRAATAAAVTGTLATVAVCAAVDMGAWDSLIRAGWAVAAAGAAGAVGWGLLVAARRRPIATQVVIVALTVVAAVGASALVAAPDVSVSDRDAHVLAVVLLAGGTVGVVVALLLGERVAASSRSLRRAVQGMADGGRSPTARHASEELATLARELEAMSVRLDQARRSERALEQSRRDLVAWVSHDLRTPLAAIRAITEALEDGVVDSPETVRRYYSTLRTEADRLAGLVDDLFELSRIHAGAIRMEVEVASLGDLVSDALAAAGPVASAKGVRLEGRLEGEPPDLMLSTPEFSRVLRNLLENAIRHTPSDGTVWVEAGAEEGAAYVSVADGCGGIAPEHLDRVFEVAFRGEDARTPGDGIGAGLGLAIAKGLVDAHDGEIVVANEDGGCRFTVRLPLPTSRP